LTGTVFLKVFRQTETVSQGFPTVSQNTVEIRFIVCTTSTKIHSNLALRPSQYSYKIVASSQNVFALSKVKH